ncbi:MAG TPA: hypothetical protein VKY31_08085 [Terriglobia bacterium]|nr:hypothetical protein [Terriglobia bacterium]
MNPKELHELFVRPERPQRSVLTVYLDVDQTRAANLNRGFETQLKNTLAPVRSLIHEPADIERFNKAAHYLTDFVGAYRPAGRALALFFDETDGFFRYVEMDVPVRNEARWDQELFIQPLANAMNELENYGIVLVDRNNLRLFTVFLGHIEEHVREEFGTGRVRHIKTVGTDHLGSASHVQRKADEHVRLNLRHAAKLTDWLVDTRKLSRFILAGTPEVIAELRGLFPKRLALRIMGSVDLSMETPTADVLAATRPIAQQYEREAESQTVNEMVTSAAKDERAVIGLGHTLKAVNSDRVWELVYCEDFHAPGFECSRCGALFSMNRTSCQYCGASVHAIADVVERVVDRAFRNGARVETVTGEASAVLDRSGGIGAFLKTRTGTVRI